MEEKEKEKLAIGLLDLEMETEKLLDKIEELKQKIDENLEMEER